jgi:hypothetical protein
VYIEYGTVPGPTGGSTSRASWQRTYTLAPLICAPESCSRTLGACGVPSIVIGSGCIVSVIGSECIVSAQ